MLIPWFATEGHNLLLFFFAESGEGATAVIHFVERP